MHPEHQQIAETLKQRLFTSRTNLYRSYKNQNLNPLSASVHQLLLARTIQDADLIAKAIIVSQDPDLNPYPDADDETILNIDDWMNTVNYTYEELAFSEQPITFGPFQVAPYDL